MTSNTQGGISSDRVVDTNEVCVTHLECSICRDILWKPVACQTCETPFCSSCVHKWLSINPNICPNRCDPYKERKCPPFIAKLLSQLQISCTYKPNGCIQIIPYEALDQHEIDCDYKFQQCLGCRSQILKKDFDNHVENCELVELFCQDCQLVYKRNEAATKHTEMICLKQQLRQIKEEHKLEINELTNQLNEIRVLNPSIIKSRITFEDLPTPQTNISWIPNLYRELKWTGIAYGQQLRLSQTNPTSGYVTSLTTGNSPHIAFFSKISLISAQHPDKSFTLISLTTCAAWNDNLELNITGYRNSEQVNAHRTTLLFGKPQLILLQWKNINKVTFSPSGGTPHRGSGGTSGLHVVLTQITIDQVD